MQVNSVVLYQAHKIIVRLIIIDQLTKWWFIDQFSYHGQVMDVTSFLRIVYVWNYGISFGLFNGYYDYSNVIFLILNSIIVIYLYSLVMKTISTKSFIGYSWVIGGALGNICDRLAHGAVFDFIFFHYGENIHFPAFNIADSCIFIGVVIVLYDIYSTKHNNNIINKKTVEPSDKNFYDDLQSSADLIRLADENKIKQYKDNK